MAQHADEPRPLASAQTPTASPANEGVESGGLRASGRTRLWTGPPLKSEGTSGRLVEAGLEPDLNLVLSDIDAKLQLFETVQNRAQDLYDYLEDTK